MNKHNEDPCRASVQAPLEACGACVSIAASTPLRIDNRSGLSAIAYRIGEQPQFKESLLAGLSSSKYPQLDGVRTRDADDFTLGLIDAVACAADVLTFYQERIANESYLRTATERVSLQEMAKLIGYRLRPGVAAETLLAFALEPPKTPPPGMTADPGAFVTGIPTRLTLDAGLQVQSVPGPDEKPQTFETIEAIGARPEWNALRAVTSQESIAGHGTTEVWLHGVDSNLKTGDWLLIVGAEFDADATSTRWDTRVLTAVEPDADHQRTRLAWRTPLANVSAVATPNPPPGLYALRQRTSVFGHNAPSWNAMSAEFKVAYLEGGTDPKEWPAFDIYCDTTASFTIGGGIGVSLRGIDAIDDIAVTRHRSPVSLDGSYPKIVAPSLALLVTPSLSVLCKVSAVSERSRAQFAISGKSTCISLRGDNLARFSDRVRELSIYVQSERLQRGMAPKLTPLGENIIDVVGDVTALPSGRRLLIKGTRADNSRPLVHAASLMSATAGANDSTLLTIDPPLPTPLRRDSVIVHANVALATHGETVTEVLGAGDASQAHQRFELKRLPLTYRSATNETGADSELSIRVGDVEWQELPTLFGAKPNDRVYTLSTDEQGKRWVVFGDGVRGARLPSGVNNVRATYRQGLGQDGNVAAEQLTQLKTRPLGLKSVSNAIAALGGSDPEPADQARRSMPLGTRTLGRAVSLLDYEDFALAFTGIAKAQARVLQLGGGPTIVITIAGQDGEPLSDSNPIWHNLDSSLKAGGDPHVRIQLLSYQASTFRIGLKVKRDPAYALDTVLAAVETALRARYAFDARALGQPVLESDVIAAVHAVAGVVAVDLDFFYGGSAPFFQTLRSRQRRVLASRMRVVGGVARPAELLSLHPGPLDRLQEML